MNLKMSLTQLSSAIAQEEMPAAFVRQALRNLVKAEAESRMSNKTALGEILLCLDRESGKQMERMKKKQKAIKPQQGE